MTDWKTLCAELVDELVAWERADDQFSEGGTLRADANYELVPRARAALAQPEPEGPSGDDIYELALEGDFLVDVGDGFTCMVQDEVEFARAVLARFGGKG